MPTAVSLFSGAGGFCEGVGLAGFKLSCAVEMDEHAARTHGINFPKVPMFRGDVSRFLVDQQPGVPTKDPCPSFFERPISTISVPAPMRQHVFPGSQP